MPMRNKIRYSAKDLAAMLQQLIVLKKVDEALALIERVEMSQFLPQIVKILKRVKAREVGYNTCTVMSSKELSEEALASILEHVNYNPKDKLVRIVSPDLGVGATVSYKDTFVDATLFTMLSKALNK